MSAALLLQVEPTRSSSRNTRRCRRTASNRNLATGAAAGSHKLRSGTQFSGIFDRRQGYIYPTADTTQNNNALGAHNAVHIDLAAFYDFLNSPSTDWVDTTDSSKKVYDPDRSYSGVVYVQIPLIADSVAAVSARKTTDKIRPGVAPTATTRLRGHPAQRRRRRDGQRSTYLPSLPSKHETCATTASLL